MNNDEHQEDYEAARIGNIGADRMRLRLPIIPNKERGDMDYVSELRAALQVVMDATDYTKGNCGPTAMVSAALPICIIQKADRALSGSGVNA